MIRVANVSKVYRGAGGPTAALENVDFHVSGGEFVAVVGPSGSGKSTLLFAVGGLLQPSEGTVNLAGTDVYALSPSERAALRRDRVGFVFQTFNLLPYLSCLENAALPAILAGMPEVDAQAQARVLLARLGLEARLHHRPGQLSVGERQRVAIARALVNRPGLLLADEPTGNLDPAARDEVLAVLRGLQRDGQTIVMVTHDPLCAAAADRVVHLLGGRVEQSPQRLAS